MLSPRSLAKLTSFPGIPPKRTIFCVSNRSVFLVLSFGCLSDRSFSPTKTPLVVTSPPIPVVVALELIQTPSSPLSTFSTRLPYVMPRRSNRAPMSLCPILKYTSIPSGVSIRLTTVLRPTLLLPPEDTRRTSTMEAT